MCLLRILCSAFPIPSWFPVISVNAACNPFFETTVVISMISSHQVETMNRESLFVCMSSFCSERGRFGLRFFVSSSSFV